MFWNSIDLLRTMKHKYQTRKKSETICSENSNLSFAHSRTPSDNNLAGLFSNQNFSLMSFNCCCLGLNQSLIIKVSAMGSSLKCTDGLV